MNLVLNAAVQEIGVYRKWEGSREQLKGIFIWSLGGLWKNFPNLLWNDKKSQVFRI
jgi:hypothetical protein